MSKKATEFQKREMSKMYRGKEIFKPLNTGWVDERVACVREWVANIFFYRKGDTTIMIDAGYNYDRLAEKMGWLGIDPQSIRHILITHQDTGDMYGHSAGDEALVAVSEAVRSRLCEDEILVRWGGEEFIVIMKQNERRFEEHAQEIREAVEQLQLETGTVTISVGVAECSKENYQETIKHADTALYRAKNMGRNRVVMYCSEMDSADNGYCG